MSTNVVGLVPPDEDWRKKKAAWDALRAINVEPPRELFEFFGLDPGTIQEPDPNGVLVDIPASEWKGEYGSGLEVRLDQVPEKVKVIRFYNSW